MLDAKQMFFWMQMNGFSVSVIAESGSYDEVKQALILKGKKICARGHTIYFTWISQKSLQDVICSHLVLWQKTKVRHMMSRTTKDAPAFWLFRLLPSLCCLEMWINPQKKNLLIQLLYSTTPCWGWDKRKHFTGEEAWRQIEQLCKNYYVKYVLIRLSNCWNQFHY